MLRTIKSTLVFLLTAPMAIGADDAEPQASPPSGFTETEPTLNTFQQRHARMLRAAMENIRLGVPVNTRNKQGYTALMLAAAAGNLTRFHELLHVHNADAGLEAPGKVNLLMLAAAGGNEQLFRNVQKMLPHATHKTDGNGTPLFHYACLGGNESICDAVLRQGGNAYALNNKGHSAILYAARGGNTVLFHKLLSKGANPLLLTRDRHDLLMAAAQGGEVELVQTALAMGISPTAADTAGNTALMAAATAAEADVIVGMLLRKGANPAARNRQGICAAMLAASSGNAEACRMLGGRADIAPDKAGRSLLVYAAAGGSRNLVSELLQQGASAEELNRLPLRTAIAAGHTAAALELAATLPQLPRHELHAIPIKTLNDAIAFTTFLTERCTNSSDRAIAESLLNQILLAAKEPQTLSAPSRDHRGKTPLQNAIIGKFRSFIIYLLEAGADVNARDQHGQTALMTAVESGGYETIKILLRAGADPNIMDSHGYTAAILAAEYADCAAFNILLEHGANPQLQRRGGPTALQAAMSAGPQAQEIINRLTHNPTLPTSMADAYSALCTAMDDNKQELFRRILRAWPEPNLADSDGNTLLMRAVSTPCDIFFARHLIERGANVNTANRQGVTPLFNAANEAKRQLLRRAGAVE